MEMEGTHILLYNVVDKDIIVRGVDCIVNKEHADKSKKWKFVSRII